MSKWDMQRMKHRGYGSRSYKCPLCVESANRTTCGFDGKVKLFKSNHYNCETLKALKGALRVVGTRTLGDEERESRATAWHVVLDDGTMVLCFWKRGFDGGYMELALQNRPGWGPLSLETAVRVIALAHEEAEAASMGLTNDQLADLRERLEGDDE